MSRNVISVICSTILWAIIMLLTGVLGPLAFSIGLIMLKSIGAILLLAILIRVPIVLMDKDDSRRLGKFKSTIQDSAMLSINQVAESVKRSTINMPSRDNPLMPPDYDE